MRLKQLLGVLLLLVAGSILAAAATPQLTNLSVVARGNTTSVTLRASGPFTHNEYRPIDNLLLVDLAGVNAGKLADQERELQAPGVKSYRVVGFSGAGGVQIARIELRLIARPEVKVTESSGGLLVQVTGATPAPAAGPDPAATAQPSPIPAAQPALAAPVTSATGSAPPQLVRLREVSALHTPEGLAVEILANGAISGNAQKLANPERIVIDLPNVVPYSNAHPLAVNAGALKSIRVAQFQNQPAITRVVLDLTAPQDFELVQGTDRLTVKLHRPAQPAAQPAPMPKAPEALAQAALPASAPTPALAAPKPEEIPAQAMPEPKAQAEAAPAVVAPAQKPLPAVEQAAKPEARLVASLAPLPAPQPAAFIPAVAPEPKGGGQQNANDFVVVEPTYQAKAVATSVAAPLPAAPAASQPVPAPVPVQTASAQPATPPAAPPAALPSPAPPAHEAAVNLALEQQQAQLHAVQAQSQPLQPPHYTGEPISVNLKDADLQDFFRLIASPEISGLNVVLDPGVNGKLTLVLNDVPWDQALDIVLKNNGLDKELEGNVLRIATVDALRHEANAKRAQLEAQALAVDRVAVTRFLSYAHAADVLLTVKRMLSPRGDAIADVRTNALIIQDIPSVIPAIDKLVSALDRKTQEVEIEARVVAATRSFARELGSQVGFGLGGSSFALGGSQAVGTSPLTAPPGPANPLYTNLAGAIPLFSNQGATGPTSGLSLSNFSNAYRIDVVLQAAESRGLLKILSRPRTVTQNNAQAQVRQGMRIPITTLSQLNGPPTVTYIDAFLRLTVTPQITAEGTIFLNLDIENTTPDFSNELQGNPVLLTQQATTQVLVSNGGTAVIGGVIQTNNSVQNSQIPLLGDVPVLGNLFKHRSVSTTTQELIFFITPKIVEM